MAGSPKTKSRGAWETPGAIHLAGRITPSPPLQGSLELELSKVSGATALSKPFSKGMWAPALLPEYIWDQCMDLGTVPRARAVCTEVVTTSSAGGSKG